MTLRWAEAARGKVHAVAESLGNLLVETFHYLALFGIGAVTAWAGLVAFLGMIEKGSISVDDILLLFIAKAASARRASGFAVFGLFCMMAGRARPAPIEVEHAGLRS